MLPLENLKSLKLDMETKGWTISSFLFQYKQVSYIVLVKLYAYKEPRPQYALLKLHFSKENNLNDDLEIPANSASLLIDTQTLRHYFGIKYAENLGDILREFCCRLGNSIPKVAPSPEQYSEEQLTSLVHSLSKSDAEDPSKIYCYKVRRNPSRVDGTPGQRSPFNSDKTKLLRPALYERLHDDPTLSFCYTPDVTMEKDDATIIRNWTMRNSAGQDKLWL